MRLLPIASAILLCGCTAVEGPGALPGDPVGGMCKAEAAHALVGQKADSDTGARALALSGARSLRWGPPGAVWTMDYREDRVNVRYDDSMAITEITCG